jgi:hypothetical protein
MKRNYHTNLAFLDLLFNTLLCFAALFMLSFILINPSKSENNVKAKADYIITVTWPSELNHDVDMYVQDPQGNLVAFMRREQGLMHLDRDDLGHRNDTVQTEFGPITHKENIELVILRGFMPGEYIVNVHLFSKYDSPETQATPVNIRLDKVNPTFKTVAMRDVILKIKGDEKTAFRFKLDKDGKVIEVNELPISLTAKERR